MIETTHFKKELESELATLETELSSIGRRNPDNNNDWEAIPSDTERSADENDVADNIESYEENTAVLKHLEIRYNQVKKALERIENGAYGICEVGQEEIEKERLEANPAATTCIKHLE